MGSTAGADAAVLETERLLIGGLPAGAAHGMPAPRAGEGERLPAVTGVPSVPMHARLGRTLALLPGLVDREAAHGIAFLFVPILMGAGAVLYFVAAFEPPLLAVAASIVVPAVLWLMVRERSSLAPLLLAFAIFAGGMLAAKLETVRSASTLMGSEVTTRLTAEVARLEKLANGRVRLTLDMISTERPTLRYMPERVRITARAVPENLSAGMAVTGVARLLPPSGPTRPGGYDFAFESYFDGRGATGFFLTGPELSQAPVTVTPGERAAYWFERVRASMAERIRASIGGTEGEIAAALIAGIRAGIPEEANEALRITGLAHVLSISGLHMALVAATVMATIRLVFALRPGFAARHPVKKYAAAVALAAAAFYLLLSGAEVAAQRSFIMLAVMLVALLLDQAAITMRNLAIAAVIILAISPHELMGPSFQMSFAATAALIAAYAAWSRRRETRPRRIAPERSMAMRFASVSAKYIAALAFTSIIAGFATTLYGIWHFQRVSPLSLPANLAAMPLVSVFVMPPAVLAAVLMPFGLEALPLAIMGKGLEWMLAVSHWFAERSPIDSVGQIPMSALMSLTAALLILTVSTTALRWTAVPFALAGLVLIALRTLPDAYVSEDARLVAVRTGSSGLSVNRERPASFTLTNWAFAAATVSVTRPGPGKPGQFECGKGACVLETDQTGLVVHASTAPDAEAYCGKATLIVVAIPLEKPICDAGDTTVIDARMLARSGSAELRFRRDSQGITVDAAHAVSEPFRPWHAHRAYSRAARGLPPREPFSSAGSARPAVPAP